MSKISVDFEGLPEMEDQEREWLMEKAENMTSYGKKEKDKKKKKKTKCCCPEELEFYFFWSNVIVVNENSECPYPTCW